LTGASVDEGHVAELDAALSGAFEGEVRTDSYTRHLYASDASMYAIEPLVVAFPRQADDVSAAVAVAREHQVPVLARGAGTSLAGQTVARAIVLDFSRHMNTIIEIDAPARLARVQPGVVQDQLNAAVRSAGLMFGPDTSTSNRATIGGMIGNNSAGSHSIRYGSTIDHIEELEVVLSDASRARFATTTRGQARGDRFADRIHRGVADIVDRHALALADFPPLWRHSGGYRLDRAATSGQLQLHKLLVGSEGTLGVVTEATVRLVDAPSARAIAVGHFRSTAGAIAATNDAMALDPDSVELMDRTILTLSRQRVEYADLAKTLVGDPDALLFVEFAAESPDEAQAKAVRLAESWESHAHGYHTLVATTVRDQANVLKVRKAGLGLLMAASKGTLRPLAFVEDTAVPVEVLAPYVEEFAAVLERHSMKAGFYGHCSVGCLHIRPFVDLAQPGQAEVMREVAHEIALLARRYGGVNSSEHGDGLARSEFNRELFGDDLYEAMLDTKQLFDPDGVFNPGKIVGAPPMTENLRDAPERVKNLVSVQLTTRLDFSASGGFAGAAGRCMNIGACRKEGVGVMCPSYMATREEQHSTRGRANALVKAMSEPDPAAALGGERLHEILDLCLECKACKSECPLGVDMAALKSETLFQRHQVRGTPLRSRFFGSIRMVNRAGSSIAPVANWLMRRRSIRAVAARILGISTARPLPQLHRNTILRRRRRDQRGAPRAGERRQIVLLADSFTTYSEPGIGHAAMDLLQSASFEVLLTGNLCCGRSSISKGLLDQAAHRAEAMVAFLAPLVERGVQIVGVEPSCLLTLVDEYPRLLPADPRVDAVAKNARLLVDVLLEAVDAGDITLDPESRLSGRKIVFHGHCHEKALVGTTGSRSLLERIPGADVHELDAGCCGMAGSFGYEAEHYELSMRTGDLRLFPAISGEAESTVVAASGTSCRQQIEHGTGRHAMHPVELIRQASVIPN
jgi:FAD/FMN-containing dehydrogenase/Fe-S oxidoreductase